MKIMNIPNQSDFKFMWTYFPHQDRWRGYVNLGTIPSKCTSTLMLQFGEFTNSGKGEVHAVLTFEHDGKTDMSHVGYRVNFKYFKS